MTPKATFSFDSLTSTGLDKVPLNNIILIEDSDGNGKPKQILIKNKTGVTAATTVSAFLALTAQWEAMGGVVADATGKAGYELSTDGSEADAAAWSPIRSNPNVLTSDHTMTTGTSGSVVSGFTIDDGVTLTIPDGSVLSVV